MPQDTKLNEEINYKMIADTTVVVTDIFEVDSVATVRDSAISISPEVLFGTRAVLSAPAKKPLTTEWREQPSGLFEGFLALGIILLFLLLFRYVRKFFAKLATGLFNFRIVEKQFKENSLSAVFTSRVLLFFAWIAISFFCWLALLHAGLLEITPLSAWQSFLVLTSVLIAFFLIKFSLLWVVEFVGKSAPVMQLINFYGRLCIIFCGFLILPVALLMATTNADTVFGGLLITGVVMMIACTLLYIFRIFQIFFTAHISIFFLILYLCTFEIAPFLLLYFSISMD
jgi:hypothetical protein